MAVMFWISLLETSFFVHVWSTLSTWSDAGLDMPSERLAAAIGMINNEIIYQFGGSKGFYDPDTSIIKLNLSESNPIWHQLPSPIPSTSLMCAHTCTTIIQDRYIYIFSLYKEWEEIVNDDWHIFDALTETWQSIVKPNINMDPLGCIVSDSNEFIYHIGGSYTWLYTISSNTWSPLSSPITPQSRQSCIYYADFEQEGDVILSIGGTAVNPGIYKYLVNTNEWKSIQITGASITRIDTDAILATDDKIYVIGGEAGSMIVNVFDPHTNTVAFAPNLNDALSSGMSQSVAFGDEIYVFGGWRFVPTNLFCCALKGSQKSNILTKEPTVFPSIEPTPYPILNPTVFPSIETTVSLVSSTNGIEYILTETTDMNDKENKTDDDMSIVVIIASVIVLCLIIGCICLLRETRIKDNRYRVNISSLKRVSSNKMDQDKIESEEEVQNDNNNDKNKVIYMDEGRSETERDNKNDGDCMNNDTTSGENIIGEK